jgi:hypothetical protein
VVGGHRIPHAPEDRAEGRLVEHQLHPLHGRLERRRIGNVRRNQFDSGSYFLQVLQGPGAKVVDHADRVSIREERFHEVRADEPGPPGYKPDCHETSLNGD